MTVNDRRHFRTYSQMPEKGENPNREGDAEHRHSSDITLTRKTVEVPHASLQKLGCTQEVDHVPVDHSPTLPMSLPVLCVTCPFLVSGRMSGPLSITRNFSKSRAVGAFPNTAAARRLLGPFLRGGAAQDFAQKKYAENGTQPTSPGGIHVLYGRGALPQQQKQYDGADTRNRFVGDLHPHGRLLRLGRRPQKSWGHSYRRSPRIRLPQLDFISLYRVKNGRDEAGKADVLREPRRRARAAPHHVRAASASVETPMGLRSAMGRCTRPSAGFPAATAPRDTAPSRAGSGPTRVVGAS
ncbi:uncharacterized protein Tco025E_08745 [Trypanosoma conorhini]|uniref:Uncharacterized protein n=1 Tax=Trypanosoma conorhini TaxID=83891 RepID=A0A422N5J8_9TRYP|nr:uncharacterized protein Tco025E_08745 [Trypanosoma conorhini]RNF00711.1 hypothetical protein Tco025E_08745 [Trypanosoma conorhini]